MQVKVVVKCTIVALALLHQCHSQTDDDQRHLDGLKVNASLISEENVTRRDNSFSKDNKFNDKSQNTREFPSSVRHRRSLDKNYQDTEYYDDGISPALTSEEGDGPVECILERSEFYLSWWVHENGSLKLPASSRTGNTAGFADLSISYGSEATIFRKVADLTSGNASDVIIFMSIANNQLQKLPIETLNLVNFTLQYLSLANNDFSEAFETQNSSFQSWSNFPLMGSLRELDLRNCSMSYLEEDLFDNFPNLEKLFLSHNFFKYISSRTFQSLTKLSHLDLSYNNKLAIEPYNSDPFSIDSNGVLFDEDFFVRLENLILLDLSHSILKQDSLKALRMLQSKVEQLSLCYTKITVIAADMFRDTNLKVLDLSGNPTLTPSLSANWFGGLEGKLEILIFRDSNLKNIAPLRGLRNLKMLDLDNNNINQIFPATFSSFANLEILDLNSNHISNWYESVLRKNERLLILNLRKNNINLITSQMMTDFDQIKYLAIGANSFVCECSLREFIDRASLNAQVRQCPVKPRRKKRSTTSNLFEEFYNPEFHYEVFLRQFHSYVKYADESCKNIIGFEEASFSQRSLSAPIIAEASADCDELYLQQQNPESTMSFTFLLLDYNENDYHCIDSSELEKQKLLFSDLEPCPDRNFRSTEPTSSFSSTSNDGLEIDDGYGDNIVVGPTRKPNQMIIIFVAVCVPLTLIISLWFWYRRELRYFWSIFKNTLILSLEKEDKKALMMTNRKRKSHASDNFIYDVFVSYCDKDREWVLDHLIPNIERRSEVTICLHERDFQVGLSILENIIQCMDQSRCLLLVISESFLKSNWCSFEMHLAQHRLIETRREQLILVLLQDIPKSKRPRTLNFLMRTKTYIMWPSNDSEEHRNVFWKRLKKAIIPNNWEPERVKAKPRHSVV